MTTQRFHIGHVLSITTGHAVANTESPIEGIYEILNFMTGDNLFTHVLPRASDVCGPYLLGQFPQLRDAADSKPAGSKNPDDWFAWRDALAAEHGEFFEVEALPAGVWEAKDPLEELADMVGPEKIFVI